MNTTTDTPVSQLQHDILQVLLGGVGVLEKIGSNQSTLLNIEFRPTSGEVTVAMLFALIAARRIAAEMEDGIAKEKLLQKLERSISNIAEHSCSEIQALPRPQDSDASDQAFAPVATALSLTFQVFTKAVREDVLRMANQILQTNTAGQKMHDQTSRETVDGRSSKPSASSLNSVISYSSSLHEWWFW